MQNESVTSVTVCVWGKGAGKLALARTLLALMSCLRARSPHNLLPTGSAYRCRHRLLTFFFVRRTTAQRTNISQCLFLFSFNGQLIFVHSYFHRTFAFICHSCKYVPAISNSAIASNFEAKQSSNNVPRPKDNILYDDVNCLVDTISFKFIHSLLSLVQWCGLVEWNMATVRFTVSFIRIHSH